MLDLHRMQCPASLLAASPSGCIEYGRVPLSWATYSSQTNVQQAEGAPGPSPITAHAPQSSSNREDTFIPPHLWRGTWGGVASANAGVVKHMDHPPF